jgi:putative endonuclease
MNNWLVYLVECSDGTKYCGATNNIEKRIKTHNSGKGAKYTRVRRPVRLLITSRLMPKWDALKLEREVKKQKASKKVDYLQMFAR